MIYTAVKLFILFSSGSTGAIIEAAKNESSPLTIANATFDNGEAGLGKISEIRVTVPYLMIFFCWFLYQF